MSGTPPVGLGPGNAAAPTNGAAPPQPPVPPNALQLHQNEINRRLQNVALQIHRPHPPAKEGWGQRAKNWFQNIAVKKGVEVANRWFDKDRKNDTVILTSIFGDVDIINQVKLSAPHLFDLIYSFVPKDAKLLLKNRKESLSEFINGFILHIIANLALSELHPDLRPQVKKGKELQQKIKIEEFISRQCIKIFSTLGREFNEVDQKISEGAQNKPELFKKVSEELMDTFLPKKDPYHSIVVEGLYGSYSEHLAKALSSMYDPLDKWFKGIENQNQEGEKGIGSNIKAYFLGVEAIIPNDYRENIVDYLDRDLQTIADFTGKEINEQTVLQCIPRYLNDLLFKNLPENLKKLIEDQPEISNHILIHVFTNLASDLCMSQLEKGETLDLPKIVEAITNHFLMMDKSVEIVSYFTNVLSDHYIHQDQNFFVQLTGSQNANQFILQKISPELREQILKHIPGPLNDLAKKNGKLLDAILLRVAAVLSKDVFSNELACRTVVSEDKIVPAITSKFLSLFKNAFDQLSVNRENERANRGNERAILSQLSFNLLNLFLPNERYLREFMERRKENLTRPMIDGLKAFFDTKFKIDQSVEHSKDQLRRVFWDREAIIQSRRFDQIPPEYPTVQWSRNVGIEPMVEQIFNLSDKLFDFAKEKLPNVFQEGYIAQALELLNSGDNNVSWFTNETGKSLKAVLFKILAQLFEKVPKEDRLPAEKLLAGVIKMLLNLCKTHIPLVYDQIQADAKKERTRLTEKFGLPTSRHFIEDETARVIKIEKELQISLFEKTQKLLEPFFHDLIQTLFGDLLRDFPEVIRNKAEGLLLQLITEMFLSTTRWMGDEVKANRERLDHIYHSKDKNCAKLCHVLGELAVNGIANEARKNTHKIINAAMKSIDMFIPATPESAPLREMIRKMIACGTKFIGDENSEGMKPFWILTKKLVESLLLFMFVKVSKDVKKTDEGQPASEISLLEKAALRGMQRMEVHVEVLAHIFKTNSKKISKIKRLQNHLAIKITNYEKKISKAKATNDTANATKYQEKLDKSKAKLTKITKEFDDIMTKGFEDAQELHPASKDQETKTEFAEILSPEILKIFGLNVDNLPMPVPNLARGLSWDLLQDKVFPILINLIFDNIVDKHNLNSMINSILLKIQKEIESNVGQEEVTPVRRIEDAYQIELESASTRIIQSIVKLHPSKIAGGLFRIKAFRERLGVAMGEPLRAELRKVNKNMPPSANPINESKPMPMIDVLDEVMGAINDSIDASEYDPRKRTFTNYKCEWNENTQEFEFKKDDQVINEPRFDEMFPKPEQEQAVKKKKDQQLKQLRKFIPKAMRSIIDEQTNRFVEETYTRVWSKIEVAVDRFVSNFGRNALKWRNVIMPFLKIFLGIPLKIFLVLFQYLIWLPFRFIMNFYFADQLKHRTKAIELKIHENVAYQLGEDLVQFMRPREQLA